MGKTISPQTLQRMPDYLEYLKSLPDLAGNVTARVVAEALSLGEIQVRKDLASVSDGGRPRVGYRVDALIADMEAFLGCNSANKAVLVGAGKLGRALLGHPWFMRYGLDIVAAFDVDWRAWGLDPSGKPVFSLERLPAFCRLTRVFVGIITVPADQAQAVCDTLAESGIRAVWNFAPVHLTAPGHILIQNENMAASLARLNQHLRDAMAPSQSSKEEES